MENLLKHYLKTQSLEGRYSLVDIEKKLEIAQRLGKSKSILHYLCKMTDICGAVMNPIGLSHLALAYLKEHHPNNNNTSLARSLAYLYACLCNEYRLMVRHKRVKQNDDFYMPKWKWRKYMLGGKIQEQTKMLEKMGWIDCHIKTYSTKPFKREHYSINLDMLIWLYSCIKNFESEKLAALRENRLSDDEYYDMLEKLLFGG